MNAPSTNLTTASRQWASRPADERFGSVQALHEHCLHQRQISREVEYPLKALRVEVHDTQDDIRVVSPSGGRASLTNWSFGQLCRRVQAPAAYLSDLPAALATECLNHGIGAADADAKAAVLLHTNGSHSLRAITSEKYDRIWNADITSRLNHLQQLGWQVPPARPVKDNQPGARRATASDILAGNKFGLSVKEGDMIAPAGLYASDRDVFAFMVDERNRINDGSEGGLARGFFVQNSEVGDSSFKLTTFLYRMVCGNHIVWGAQGVQEIKIRHIGDANGRAWAKMEMDLRRYANDGAGNIEEAIKRAKALVLGDKKETVLDMLFQRGIAGRDQLEQTWGIGEAYAAIDGAPDTAWGMANALTRFSQTLSYAAARTNLDRAAGRVLALAN